ncbi:MAG TPA: L-type lectin-domain containing protein [Phycisphaerales bacterium]|nr:L-type lectin-domain containing protein [Phycisphaerales bacterium]
MTKVMMAAVVTAAAGTAFAGFQHAYFFGQSPEVSAVGPAAWDPNNGTYRLTTAGDQSGAMWHTARQQIDGGFVTTFTFHIEQGQGDHGDGFAFVIHNDANGSVARGGGGSSVGYGPGVTNDGGPFVSINEGIAVEFDTWSCCGEAPTPHVSIQTMNFAHQIDYPDNASLASAELSAIGDGINILDNSTHVATVQYTPPDPDNNLPGRLDVYVDDFFACGVDIDLGAVPLVGGGGAPVFDTDEFSADFGSAWVGFTAGTGLAGSIHHIDAWAFDGDTGQCLAPFWWLAGNGSGCVEPDGPCGMGIGVVAQGTRPMAYTWFRDGAEIADDEGGRITGLGTREIEIDPTTSADNAYYRVEFANSCGSGAFGDIFATSYLYCNSIDFNNDGLFPDNADLEEFLSVFGGAPCAGAGYNCDPIDFNNDGLFPDNADLEAFFSVFGGGPCLR